MTTTHKTYFYDGAQPHAVDQCCALIQEKRTTSASPSGYGLLVMDTSGTAIQEQRYLPFGEAREIDDLTAITETDLTYTGQRAYAYIKLIDFGSRPKIYFAITSGDGCGF